MRGLAAPLTKLVVFVLVTILATGILAFTIANINFTATSTYKARFTDATSVHVGDDVRIAGVIVGSVQSIKIVDHHTAQLGFSVEKGISLPASVEATIKYRNLVGQRYVSLTQGTGGNPNATLSTGSTIPLERTHPALDLTELFNGFRPLFAALNPGDVNKLSHEIIAVLQGEGGTVDALLSHTASLTSKVADKDAVIGRVIDNLNSVLDTINARTPQLSKLIVTVQQLVSGLAQDRKPIGNAITALSNLAPSVSGLLEQARPPLRKDIARLGKLTQNLNQNQATVEHFIKHLPVKLDQMIPAASYGSWFNFFLCSTRASISVPPIITKPVVLNIPPSSAARCTS
jgi:phospholipid/cholesterol/gamma-HCH transport system substrate-binding protein